MTATLLKLPIVNKDTSVFKSLHAAILAAGMVQTADTGQLDMTVAPTYNTSSSTTYGYTIYRFNDAAQATLPIYFKITWMNPGVSPPNFFIFQITIGTGSDGAGTITGIQQTNRSFMNSVASSNPTQDAQLYTAAVAGDGSCLTLLYGFDHPSASNANASPAATLIIDRLRNADGSVKTTGYMWQCGGNNGIVTASIGFYSTTYGVINYNPPDSNNVSPQLPAFFPWLGTVSTSQVSGVYPCFPVWILNPGPEYIKAAICVPILDFPPTQTFRVTNLGSSHTYITPAAMVSTRAGYGHKLGGMNGMLAVLFE
jgi:hypothetical protein